MKTLKFWIRFIEYRISEIGTYLCGCTLEDVWGDSKTPYQRAKEEIEND